MKANRKNVHFHQDVISSQKKEKKVFEGLEFQSKDMKE
jgi:hypothetical protein